MDFQQVLKDDALLHTAFHMYQSSTETFSLRSEKKRKVFAENFETISPLPLSTLCLKIVAENFKDHPIILNIKETQKRISCEFIDENMPIVECINIEHEHFWKRIYSSMCTDKMILKQKNEENGVYWKKLVLNLKYIDLIENTPYELWIDDEMDKITQIVSPYITELNIGKLQAMREKTFKRHYDVSRKSSTSTITTSDGLRIDPAPKERESQESHYDFPFQDCHHINLGVLKSLLYLNSLTIEFFPPKLSSNYHERFFNFSYIDMQNLASGITELSNLRIFKIRRSHMDSIKFRIIIEALKMIFVNEVEFYFCQLEDDCGDSLFDFIISTKSLTHLELSGNYFKGKAIDCLSNGVEASDSNIAYLGLSNNPLNDESLCYLSKILEPYEHLKLLKLSGIQNSDMGALGITSLIKNSLHLVELQIIANKMNGFALIEALKNNLKIQKILCQGCGLTLEEEFKVELLLKRNRYIKANPYIGDTSKTEEEIIAFIRRTKNPTLIKTLEKKKTTCSLCETY